MNIIFNNFYFFSLRLGFSIIFLIFVLFLLLFWLLLLFCFFMMLSLHLGLFLVNSDIVGLHLLLYNKSSLSTCNFTPILNFHLTILFLCLCHIFNNSIIISLSSLLKSFNLISSQHFINNFTNFLSIIQLLFSFY